MKPLLSCLLFCFTLFYSASSVAYNEAMCILIKQEMQQYSDDKTSRKYRNAARDYKKNCSNPARTQPATKPKPQPIIEQPIPEITKPQVTEPVSSVVNAPIAQSQTQSSLAQQSAKSNVEQIVATASEQDIEQSIKHTQSTTVPASAITEPNKSQSNKTTNDQPSIDTTTQNNTTPAVTKSTVEPLQTAMPVTVNATEQVNGVASSIPKKSNMLSLVLPSVALLLVVIIGVVVLMRLRHVKQNNEPADTSMPLAAPPTKCDDKQSSTAIDESKTLDTSKSEPNANEVSTAKVKQIPNTAEFEAAAKATLERIKNATEHAEPQVRDFDPEAKPIKKQRSLASLYQRLKKKHLLQLSPFHLNNQRQTCIRLNNRAHR